MMSTDSLSLSIINALPEHIAVIDQSGLITHTNNAWDQFALENSGNLNNTGIGVNYLDICLQSFGDDQETAFKAVQGIRDVLNGRKAIYSLEYPCHSNQEKRWFLMNVTPLPKPQGGAVLSHINITKRKFLEESRRVAEIGYWEWDRKNNNFFLNQEAKTILLRDKAKSIFSFNEFINSVHPEEREQIKKDLLSAIDIKPEFKCDFRVANPGNEKKYVHFRAEILHLDETDNNKIIGSVFDITDLRRTQNELETSENRFRAIFHNAPIMIDAFNPDGQCLLWNNECQKTLGWSIEELNNIDDILSLFYPDETIKKEVLKAIEAAEGVFDEYKVLAKNKSIRNQLWANFNISNNETIGVGYDITERKKAEKELKHNEEQLKLITDSVPALIAYVGNDRHYRYVNGVYEDWFGLKKEQIVGQHISRIMGENLYNQIKPKIDSVLSGTSVSFENKITIKQGIKKYISVTYAPLFKPENNVNGFISVIQDVTYRKETSELIRLQTEILENMSEGVHLIDHNGLFIYTNPTFDTMFGYESGELLNQHVSILNAPIDIAPKEVAENIIIALKKDCFWSGEVLNQRKDGSLMYCRANVTSFTHNEYGDLWLTVQEDISEQKQAQELVKKNQELLRSITDSVPALIAYLDNDLRVSYINNLYEQWFEIPDTNYLNKHASELVPSYIYRQHKKYLQCALNGEKVNYEAQIPKFDGTARYLNIEMIPHIEESHVLGVSVLATDMTEIKTNEQKRLKQARKQRDQLVKEVHHRIKNNLQSVSGLLRRHIHEHADLKPYIEEAISQVNAIALIHGLKSVYYNEPIHLKELLVSIIEAAKALTFKNIEFTAHVDYQVIIAEHESVPIALILNELLINAIKYSDNSCENDSIHISFQLKDIAVIVEIRNRGQLSTPGFDFEASSGIGMGLKLVKSLLPVTGAKVEIAQEEKAVIATLQLSPPVISFNKLE